MEPWRVSFLVVGTSHHFDEDPDTNQSKPDPDP
jgi:hypothetical protein